MLLSSICLVAADLMTDEIYRTSLHSLSTIIGHNLAALTTHLSSASTARLVSGTAAYPLPNFPGAAEEALLVQLLRRKLEVGVEDWVREGRDEGARAEGQLALEELWAWAGPAANEEARARDWVEEEFTKEERDGGIENVQTGLRRRLGEESESEDENDEDGEGMGGEPKVEEGAQKAAAEAVKGLSMDEVLRFMSVGSMPTARPTAPGISRR